MEIEKLIERLDDWEGCDAIYKGKFVEANCRIASRLLEEAASALEQLQAENEGLKAERDLAIKQLRGYCHACKNYTPNHNEGPCAGCKHEYFQYQTLMQRICGIGAVQRRNEHETVDQKGSWSVDCLV